MIRLELAASDLLVMFVEKNMHPDRFIILNGKVVMQFEDNEQMFTFGMQYGVWIAKN